MNDMSQRAVFTLDGKTQKFVPAGHNLTFGKAETLITRLQGKGLRVSSVVQTDRHKGHGYKNCASCKTAAENLSEEQNPTGESTAAEPAEKSQASAE
jgi:hypothetical protein